MCYTAPSATEQPAAAVLRARRISQKDLAKHLGVTPVWVGRVLRGYVRPPDRFKSAVAELLDLGEGQLFIAPDRQGGESVGR